MATAAANIDPGGPPSLPSPGCSCALRTAVTHNGLNRSDVVSCREFRFYRMYRCVAVWTASTRMNVTNVLSQRDFESDSRASNKIDEGRVNILAACDACTTKSCVTCVPPPQFSPPPPSLFCCPLSPVSTVQCGFQCSSWSFVSKADGRLNSNPVSFNVQAHGSQIICPR